MITARGWRAAVTRRATSRCRARSAPCLPLDLGPPAVRAGALAPRQRRHVFDGAGDSGERSRRRSGGSAAASPPPAVEVVPAPVEHRERKPGERVAGWAARDHGMRTGRRRAADQLPGHAEPPETRRVERGLQAREKDVLLVAAVLLQDVHEPVEELGPFRVAALRPLERGPQLVDLLVLLLDAQGDLLAVSQRRA